MEAADLGSCPVCCCAIYLCGPCALAKARCAVAEKYGIEESGVQSCLLACCCRAPYTLHPCPLPLASPAMPFWGGRKRGRRGVLHRLRIFLCSQQYTHRLHPRGW